ncbi:MAG: site-specific integrase [Pyrinomonadaceae bacterium MAG19_C2-C3]|nr:site-specific integrase [Pyrinomonadaceae bacterium MAG19_C2-C3]
MTGKRARETSHIVARKNMSGEKALIRIEAGLPDTVLWWLEQYFRFEVTTGESSRKVQRRDLQLFLDFMTEQENTDERVRWSPRLSKSFHDYLRRTKIEGERRWNDRTINRVMSHLKTFAKWVHRIRPFPLGDPVAKIKLQPVGVGLEIERALTPAERRKMLDAADLLLETGGRSRDRSRYRNSERPVNKSYRPFRNRAIVYALIETGMRRAAITNLNLSDINWKRRELTVTEKGGATHTYSISWEGLDAIRVYVEDERETDAAHWKSPALFLTAYMNPRAGERLSPRTINVVWNEISRTAGVEGRTPHSARHAMGKHIIERTGNIAAVQRQLGHKNAVYSMQYARITSDEIRDVIDNR